MMMLNARITCYSCCIELTLIVSGLNFRFFSFRIWGPSHGAVADDTGERLTIWGPSHAAVADDTGTCASEHMGPISWCSCR